MLVQMCGGVTGYITDAELGSKLMYVLATNLVLDSEIGILSWQLRDWLDRWKLKLSCGLAELGNILTIHLEINVIAWLG